MAKIFTKIDNDGFPIAFYDENINEIPENAFEVSETDWQEFLENQGERKFKDGVLVQYNPPAPVLTVAEQIATLEATVTPRRIREAILGTDGGWLAEIEAEIESLRAQL